MTRGVGAGASASGNVRVSVSVGVGGGGAGGRRLWVWREEAAGGDAAGDGVVEGCGAVGCALVGVVVWVGWLLGTGWG